MNLLLFLILNIIKNMKISVHGFLKNKNVFIKKYCKSSFIH